MHSPRVKKQKRPLTLSPLPHDNDGDRDSFVAPDLYPCSSRYKFSIPCRAPPHRQMLGQGEVGNFLIFILHDLAKASEPSRLSPLGVGSADSPNRVASANSNLRSSWSKSRKLQAHRLSGHREQLSPLVMSCPPIPGTIHRAPEHQECTQPQTVPPVSWASASGITWVFLGVLRSLYSPTRIHNFEHQVLRDAP